jgi:hypothetical protein
MDGKVKIEHNDLVHLSRLVGNAGETLATAYQTLFETMKAEFKKPEPENITETEKKDRAMPFNDFLDACGVTMRLLSAAVTEITRHENAFLDEYEAETKRRQGMLH